MISPVKPTIFRMVSLLPAADVQGHHLHVAGGQLPLRRPRWRHCHAAAHRRWKVPRPVGWVFMDCFNGNHLWDVVKSPFSMVFHGILGGFEWNTIHGFEELFLTGPYNFHGYVNG